jgi:hypothetical protein
MKILADFQNIGVSRKYRRNRKILALHENIGGFVKSMHQYDRTKADVEISAPGEKLCAYQKIRRISYAPAYYLGSAESPTDEFVQVWLKSSLSSNVASRACRPQVI